MVECILRARGDADPIDQFGGDQLLDEWLDIQT
jgi:hypothetical protein